MTIGYAAVLLIGAIMLTGFIGFGIMRIKNAKALGRLAEARGRFVLILGVCFGIPIMLFGAITGIQGVGIFGGAVLIFGGLLGVIVSSSQSAK